MEWFCGMTEEPLTATQTMQEFAEHMRKVTSLRQDPRARVGLYAGMVILFVVDIFLYVFFSTGSDFGLIRRSWLSSALSDRSSVMLHCRQAILMLRVRPAWKLFGRIG